MNRKKETEEQLMTKKDFDVFDLQIFVNAFKGTSFTPKQRGVSYKDSAATDLHCLYLRLMEIAPGRKEEIESDMKEISQKYKKKYETWMIAKSRCLSPMIAGSANFNTRKSEKAFDSERKIGEELSSFYKKVKENLIKKYKPTPVIEKKSIEILFDKYRKTKKEGVYDMPLIKGALERKLINLVKQGEGDLVKKTIKKDNYKIFTKRHGIHKKIDNIMQKLNTEKTEKL